MKTLKFTPVAVATLFAATLALCVAATPAKTEVLQGWLSDEQCGKGRAESGAYTATNPECAKECVAKGKKIVFIDPKGKRVLDIANQDMAKNNVGDYVEITGAIDPQTKTIKADSIKFLEKTSPMCEAPAKKPAKSKTL